MSTSSVSLSPPAVISENINSVPCGVCRRQYARYTCPNCNLPYCSLTCYRSPNHTECSEGFYRKELEVDIGTAPSKTTEERRKMMEMLKRFEEESKDDDLTMLSGDDSDDSEDDGGLDSRLANLDLENATYDDIWGSLTPEERDKFLHTLNDPTGDLAKQLLSSGELNDQAVEPWWEAVKELDEPQHALSNPSTIPKRHGHRPKLADIPPTAIKAAETVGTSGPSLLYNICAVTLAYAFVTRHLSRSPLESIPIGDADRDEAIRLLSTLLPFVTDRKSKTVLPSLSSVITDLWSRFDQGTMTSAFFSIIMRDAVILLRPAPISAISDASPDKDQSQHPSATHASSHALHALSDIATLFQTPTSSAPARRHAPNPVSAKLSFYMARIVSTPAYILTALASELSARASLVEREGESNGTKDRGDAKDVGTVSAPSNAGLLQDGTTRPRIDALS